MRQGRFSRTVILAPHRGEQDSHVTVTNPQRLAREYPSAAAVLMLLPSPAAGLRGNAPHTMDRPLRAINHDFEHDREFEPEG